MRSVLAIIGGYIAMSLGIIATSLLVGKLFPGFVLAGTEPSPNYVVFNLAYSAAFAIVGGYVAGVIAGKEPLKHALLLAAICSFLFFLSLFAPADKRYGPAEPLWYKIGLLVILTPSLAFGGFLRQRQVLGNTPSA